MFFAPPFWQLFLLELCQGGCIYLVYTPLFNIYIYIYIYILFFTYQTKRRGKGKNSTVKKGIITHRILIPDKGVFC